MKCVVAMNSHFFFLFTRPSLIFSNYLYQRLKTRLKKRKGWKLYSFSLHAFLCYWNIKIIHRETEVKAEYFLKPTMRKCNQVRTFPLLEWRSTIWAIWVKLPDRHILALHMLVLHPILHTAGLKDEREKFLKPWKMPQN